ncbi:hypothetical protein [Endozoicomonas elysicola]|uniref:Uncharacterized protein n=1 Tax=Endozoicomonas elysicola TaxID=305900 RepID=A0A081KD44_9GAMM|nr:hypothetical protein [Endozoicomonas elysicola]KEI72070.1 hypothetical protein GV64_16250 [Endozoicomonas elysicola]
MREAISKINHVFLIFLTFSTAGSIYADNDGPDLNPNHTYTSEKEKLTHLQLDEAENPDQITEEKILDEIERINKELDKLEQSGQLDSPTKFAISGLLGTIVYGVAHAQIAWFFRPEFYTGMVVSGSLWINAVLIGIINTAIPGLAVGALLGLSNYFPENLPQLPIEELVTPGLVAIISTLGMTLLGAWLFPACHHCISFPMKMFYTATVTVPISTLGLMATIYAKRKDLHNKKQLDLKHRLKEARKTLEQKKQLKLLPSLKQLSHRPE